MQLRDSRVATELFESFDQKRAVIRALGFEIVILAIAITLLSLPHSPQYYFAPLFATFMVGSGFFIPIFIWGKKLRKYTLSLDDFENLRKDIGSDFESESSDWIAVLIIFIQTFVLFCVPFLILINFIENQALLYIFTLIYGVLQFIVGVLMEIVNKPVEKRTVGFSDPVDFELVSRIVGILREMIGTATIQIEISTRERPTAIFIYNPYIIVTLQDKETSLKISLLNYESEYFEVMAYLSENKRLENKSEEVDIGLRSKVFLEIKQYGKQSYIFICNFAEEDSTRYLADDDWYKVISFLFEVIT